MTSTPQQTASAPEHRLPHLAATALVSLSALLFTGDRTSFASDVPGTTDATITKRNTPPLHLPSLPKSTSPEERCRAYRTLEAPRGRLAPDDHASHELFITADDPFIKHLSSELTKGCASREEKAKALLDFVCRSIEIDEGHPRRFPVETAVDHRGSSEDRTLLFVSLCRAQEIDALLLSFPDKLAAGIAGNYTGASYKFRNRDFYLLTPQHCAAGTPLCQPGAERVVAKAAPKIFAGGMNGLVSGTDGTGHDVEFSIPADTYEAYRARVVKRSTCALTPGDYLGFVTKDDPLIRRIASTLTKGLDSDEKKAERLLDFVLKNVSYDEDEVREGRDYYRFPVETLMERTGDCEDSGFLYASLCEAAGIETCLIRFIDHVAVGVVGSFEGTYWKRNDTPAYFIANTTAEAKIGDAGKLADKPGWVFDLKNRMPGKSRDSYQAWPGRLEATTASR